MSVQIVLPDERHEQLKALQKVLGAPSIADTVAVLINDAIAARKIPDEMPGFKIALKGKGVKVEAQGAFALTMSLDNAKAFASQVRALTQSTSDYLRRQEGEVRAMTRSTIDHVRRQEGELRSTLTDIGLMAVRRGTGIKLIDTVTKVEKVVAPSVAADLARLIEKAAVGPKK